MVFVDTHTHISDEAFIGEEDAIVKKAVEAGVEMMLQADVDSSQREAMWAVAERNPGHVRCMVGLYPGSVKEDWKKELDELEKWVNHNVVAFGEIGLDYHFSTEFMEEQKEVLRIQIEMASALGLPVNIHLRDATEDFFKIMDETKHLGLKGNLHAFSGSVETFERMQKYGDWYVGIGGVVTFKNASLAETVKRIPLSRIVLETDSPYLAPTPYRGTRNDSSNIPVIAAKISELKNVSIEEVAATTTSNAIKLFNYERQTQK